MSLDPRRDPITRPVIVWLEVAARLEILGDGALAAAIRQAMDCRRIGALESFALTPEERARVAAVLGDRLGEHDPD